MMPSNKIATWPRMTIATMGLALATLASGCQVNAGGQTLPSPWYYTDDVQYFAPGPEFKLTREAAAMKAYKADVDAQR